MVQTMHPDLESILDNSSVPTTVESKGNRIVVWYGSGIADVGRSYSLSPATLDSIRDFGYSIRVVHNDRVEFVPDTDT